MMILRKEEAESKTGNAFDQERKKEYNGDIIKQIASERKREGESDDLGTKRFGDGRKM